VEREIKKSCYLLFVFLQKHLYEVFLIQINEQVSAKGSAVIRLRNVDCLLKNTLPKISNMLSIKNSTILMISVSENFLGRIGVDFFYKIKHAYIRVFLFRIKILSEFGKV
jgi:hypothetical protein